MESNSTDGKEEQTALSSRSSAWVSEFARSFKLSSRQETVLRRLVDGISVKQMAAELSISAVTARRHAEELCRKCGARNQREVLALLTRTLMDEVLSFPGNRPYPTAKTPGDTMRRAG
jgi:DNA-binding NarL/FixJ family response regulator